MGLMTMNNVQEIAKAQLESGEELKAACYGVLGIKGHCIGVTPKRLFLVRVSLFLGKVKEVTSIPRGEVSGASYEKVGAEMGGVAYVPTHAWLKFAASGKNYKFNITRTVGVLNAENFTAAEQVANLLK